MRTTPEENAALGARIADVAGRSAGPVAVLLPLRGVVRARRAGRPFHDPEADAALFRRPGARPRRSSPRPVRRSSDEHINDPAFAEAAARTLVELMARRQTSGGPIMTRAGDPRLVSGVRSPRAGRSSAAGPAPGLSAKCAEAGGIDLIIIYNSGRFRMAGRGSLAGLMPYGDANAIVMEMAREVLPVVEHTPVLAGVCGTDPFRVMARFLVEVRDAGFAGVQNFPTVGLIDGTFRQGLEETGMGYDREVAMIARPASSTC